MKKPDNNIYLSEGNRKLARNEEEYFLIWNLPAVTTCPYRTPMCEKACYARKAERMYNQVLPCRENNLVESQKTSFTYDMIESIRYYLQLPKNVGKRCYFRIHESGDFYNREYVNKWIYIASQLPEVKFLAYTKSVRYFTDIMETVPDNMVIRYSIWADSDKDDVKTAIKLNLPIYTAWEEKALNEIIVHTSYRRCDCDCKVCKMCYSNSNKLLAVAIH